MSGGKPSGAFVKLVRWAERQRQRDELARVALMPQYRGVVYMRNWVVDNNDLDGCRAFNRWRRS